MDKRAKQMYFRVMNAFYELYATVILYSSLGITKDDVLAINTSERNLDFARILARKAKEATDNGSYLMIITDERKASEVTEIYSDHIIEKSPTLFVYLMDYEEYEELEDFSSSLSARKIMEYRHLSNPVNLSLPLLPFATVPLPSKKWSALLGEDENLSSVIISDLLSLGEENPVKANNEIKELLRYDLEMLNRNKNRRCHMYSDDGLTDFYFSFDENTSFSSQMLTTRDGRTFIPSLAAQSYFRAIEKNSANGRIHSTGSFMLFGKEFENIDLYFENGKLVSFSSSENLERYFSFYISQDEDASLPSELIIAEENNRFSSIPYFAYPEWDKNRSVHITLGSARCESYNLAEDDEDKIKSPSSIITLSLPVSSSDLFIEVFDDDNESHLIFSDGMIENN